MARIFCLLGLAALMMCIGAERQFDPASLAPFDKGGMYLQKHEMGLYPGGKQERPTDHERAGIRIAATIKPLDTDGNVDEKNGRVLAMVLGHSNSRQYFLALQEHLAEKSGELHPRFEMLNAATAAQQLPEIRELRGPVWDRSARMLSQPGYSPRQVQVLFLHTTFHGAHNVGNRAPGPFPQTMQRMQADLAAVLEHCVKTWPNLKIAYLTSDGLRHFTGFEPHVWQEAFAFKWLIESQIRGEAGTGYEDEAGSPRRLPWLSWGPYIWDNTWNQLYFTDGVHPAPRAKAIFVEKYWEQLKNDPVARSWMFR